MPVSPVYCLKYPVEHTQTENYIHIAVNILKKNGTISFPSDSIYGFLTTLNTVNAQRLAQIRGRAPEKPFLTVIPENFNLDELAVTENLSSSAEKIIHESWPGKYTFIFHARNNTVYPNDGSIAMRKPAYADNPFFYDLIQKYDGPLLSTSLNKEGGSPLDDADEIIRQFGGAIDAVFMQTNYSVSAVSHIWDLRKAEPFRVR